VKAKTGFDIGHAMGSKLGFLVVQHHPSFPELEEMNRGREEFAALAHRGEQDNVPTL
jgi:hypothetical protein